MIAMNNEDVDICHLLVQYGITINEEVIHISYIIYIIYHTLYIT
jgi:hypothetical protein